MSKKNFIVACVAAASSTKAYCKNELNLFCEIMGLPKSNVNYFIGDDPHGVVDIMEGYRYFNMTDIHVVISEYEHWMEIYKTNEELRKAVDAWYYYCEGWHEKRFAEEPRWVSVKESLPEEGKTVIVWFGGYYAVAVFRDKEWWQCTGWQVGKGWSALDKISDIASRYIESWKYLYSPEQEAERSKGCPNLRSWLAGCPVDGLREATPEWKEEQRKAQEAAHQRLEEAKQALYQAIEEEVKLNKF